MSGKRLLGLSTSRDTWASCPRLCWVLFSHCHIIIGTFLLLSLWPCRKNAGDSVEESFDLLLCEPFFTFFHHLSKEENPPGVRSESHKLVHSHSHPALATLFWFRPSLAALRVQSMAPKPPQLPRLLAPREAEASSNSGVSQCDCSKWVSEEGKMQIHIFF